MAISFASIEGDVGGAGAQTVDTGSFAPSNDFLVLALLQSAISGGETPATPTVTGGGMAAWTIIAGCTVSWSDLVTFTAKITVFRALEATPGTAVMTIDQTAQTANCEGFAWEIIESTDIDTGGSNGADAIVQADNNTGDSSTAAITFASFGDASNNAGVAIAATGQGSPSLTPEAGWTGFTSRDTGGETLMRGMWRLGEDTSPTFSIGASSDWGMAGVEIKAAAAAAASFPPMQSWINRSPHLRM